jgi:phage protein D
MREVRFRLYFDNEPATKDQLDQVEDVTVDQEMDATWQARLTLPSYTDEKGRWTGADPRFAAPFGRIRVEINPGNGKFVPLIDGPVVGDNPDLSSQPGVSRRIVSVQDDSVYLSREESVLRLEKMADHEVAAQLLGSVRQIASKDIAAESARPTDSVAPVVVQRGTPMQLLRRLAARNGMAAYVLPGAQPGASIGVFKPLPTQLDGLPPLVLLGEDRNLTSFNARNDAQAPAEVTVFSLSLTDKKITSAKVSFAEVDLLGQQPVASPSLAAKRMLSPGGDAIDARARARAAASRLSFAFDVTGSVLGETYPAVLSPYRVVSVQAVEEKLTGNYLIKRVSHQLTRSAYTQSFGLIRNAQTASQAGGLGGLLGGIF